MIHLNTSFSETDRWSSKPHSGMDHIEKHNWLARTRMYVVLHQAEYRSFTQPWNIHKISLIIADSSKLDIVQTIFTDQNAIKSEIKNNKKLTMVWQADLEIGWMAASTL